MPISAMIFTLDEEVNLPRCLEGLRWCDDVIVVDSFSKDRTEEIARRSGARFFQHAFTGFGDQRNWALDNTTPRHEWILILDADEYVTPELAEEMRREVRNAPTNVAAFRLRRRFHMWGRWLKYSSLYPTWVVRLVRRKRVSYQNRGHAETQSIDGDVLALDYDLIDENLKGIEDWLARQMRYAQKEALHEMSLEGEQWELKHLLGRDPLARRALLKRIASRLPARSASYFLYGYIVKRGLLDGRDGFEFCRMRALYQGMIATYKYDLRRAAQARRAVNGVSRYDSDETARNMGNDNVSL